MSEKEQEVFVSIDMKHSYFSNDFIICLQSIFSAVEIIIELFFFFCQFTFMHNFVCIIIESNKSNFVYVLVLMYDILACHLFV